MRSMTRVLAAASACAAMALAAQPALAEPAARFAEFSYTAIDPPPAAPGEYRNPVLPGFHPDPAMVRVGEDFYLVTSTFGWFPGIPVFHSQDLVNWELIGHAIDRPGMLDFTGLRMNTDGVYAPAISWHDGTFYIFNTCVRCDGNFYVTATDPAGPWSDPVWVDFGGIDPSLFFDDDGTAWVVNNDLPEGGSTYSGHRALWVQQIDLASGAMIGPRTMIVDGGVDIATQPVWAEGPHIFKKDGWYYLNAAEGGTAEDHSQTIYRSRAVTGPYEPGPVNPTLTQRDLPRPRPDRVEATGHADFVELQDGSWWTTFLATRPFEGQLSLLGRETWLLPLSWQMGWPGVLEHGEPVPMDVKRPALPMGKKADWSQWRENFDSPLSDEWIEMRNPADAQWYAVDRERGELAVLVGTDAPGAAGKPHFLGRRLGHPRAEWTTSVRFAPENAGDLAGMMAFGSEESFVVAGIEGGTNGPRLVVRQRSPQQEGTNGALLAQAPLESTGPVELRLRIDEGSGQVAYRQPGAATWTILAQDIDLRPLASVNTGLFTGVTVGPYAYTAQ